MRKLLPIVGLVFCGLAAPACADAIDGAWCQEAGKRLMISGPSIVTPGGVRMQGLYDRHGFSYTAPAGEPGAGTTIDLRLLGEHDIESRAGAIGPIEHWRRCGPAVS